MDDMLEVMVLKQVHYGKLKLGLVGACAEYYTLQNSPIWILVLPHLGLDLVCISFVCFETILLPKNKN
jgi:hypothetical protein